MSDISPEQDFDLSFLYEIADGSDEFIVESIGMFLEQTPQLLTTIEAALNASDWVTAGQASHKLKPNLGFFGMPISQATIQEVELACKAGGENPTQIFEKFNQVKSSVGANLITLKQIKAEKEASL
ncbi:HPt (histidine-containing phosphotransfer) domain-containing protein [Mucilaginibacter pineti]|uniref:HPt (Histidine-containing phosphotransfer) domain-containing protein n=1 Tax=Mucilaginibacter pineti TaxID=1391627 RepID=A0A1G7HZJ7_9SPHI|nr:Hpt domain-containing protein [Mucilaginibacter pineti]SDF05941.1 HPt (histidine-containing phosphotransfer) domain-containing protein [Mucilaginibacter pineti]